MNPDELARYKALNEQNQELRQGLSAESRAFDEANEEMFLVIHRNHRMRAPRIEVYRFG